MQTKKQSHVLWNALKLVYRCDPKGFVLKVLYTTIGSLLPLANLYILAQIVDSVQAALSIKDGSGMATITLDVALFAAIFFLSRMVGILSLVNSDKLTQRLIDYISDQIQSHSVSLDMAYYDNPDYHDTFHRAQQEANFRPIRILDDFTNFVGSAISIVGVVTMLASASWLTLVVMIVAIIPTFIVRLVKSRKVFSFRRENTQLTRRTHYLAALLTDSAFAKETRAFGLGPFFRGQFVDIRRQLVDKLLAISRRIAVSDALSAILETAALLLIVVFLCRETVSGAITVGSFVMLFEAFRRGQQNLQTMATAVAGLYDSKLFIGNLFEFMDLKPSIASPEHPVPFPSRVESVVFNDITFSYPNIQSADQSADPHYQSNSKQRPVLQHFSLTCKRGEVTYLKGENGFGKTTLLKLLLRLYDPNDGCILVNGIDIRQFDLDELRHNVSAIFQDHVRFYFTAKQNIEFGDIHHPGDETRLQRAAELSEAMPVIAKLSKGMDTPLGRQFNQGEELSMGQWQRIALARQLYSQAPVLVFDEPTAWMDREAREQFLQNLDIIKRDKVVILIAHF